MTGIVAVVLTTWAVLVLCGFAVLAAVPPGRVRDALVPAAPALGAGALVVVLHWTALVLPTSSGWFLAVAALAGAGLAHHRRARLPRRPLAVLAVATLAGVVPLAIVLAPLLDAGHATVVQPSPNNDAFSYVTVAEWLQEHPATRLPATGRDGPAFGYAEDHLRIGLRIGEELVVAGVATMLRTDPDTVWYPALAVWFLLLPGAAAAAFGLLGHRPAVGLAGGLAAASGAVTVGMGYNQSSASVLGVALAPLVLALVHARASGRRDAPVPLWLAAGAAAALVGSYTELVPLALPAVVLAAVAGGDRRGATGRLALIGGAAVVVAPLVAWNAARSLSTTSGLTAGRPSMFLDVPLWAALHRFLGLATSTAGERPSVTGALVALALLAAVAGALAWSRARALWLGVILASVALIAYLSTVHRYPYGQERAVAVGQPLWILAAAAGADAISQRFPLRRRRAAAPAAAIAAAAVVLYAAGNVQTIDALDADRWAATRSVGREFDEAAAWVARHKGTGGGDVLALVSNFFDQLWLLYATRDAAPHFGFVHRDYASVEPYSLWDGRLPRYLIVGRDEFRSVPPAAVVASNQRFTLVDTRAAPVVVAVPGERMHFGEPGPGGVAHWSADRGELLVVRTPAAPPALELTAQALADLAPLPVTVRTATGEVLASLVLPASPRRYRIALPDRPSVLLVLDNAKPARRPAAVPEFRDLSVYLSAVRPG